MAVTLLFAVLAVIAVAGAGGLLFLRRITHCLLSFLLCAAALAGLYLLLNLQFVAATQLTIGTVLVGIAIAVNLSDGRDQQRDEPWPRYILVATGFVTIVCWGIARGSIGEPILTSPPVWSVRGGYIPALGRELVTTHLVPFALLGLFILVCIVSAAALLRQSQETDE
jgi:NADH:ubiquinone oxidoreductase subunit 6 (subunit J)